MNREERIKLLEHEERALALYVTLETLREQGLKVAVHNDYEQAGKFMTFWLFTHPSGRYFKGEGPSDIEALDEVAHKVADWTNSRSAFDALTQATGAVKTPEDGTATCSRCTATVRRSEMQGSGWTRLASRDYCPRHAP